MARRKGAKVAVPVTAAVAMSPWDVGGVGSGVAGAMLGAGRRTYSTKGKKGRDVAPGKSFGRTLSNPTQVQPGILGSILGAGVTRYAGRKRRKRKATKAHARRRKGHKTAAIKKRIKKHLTAVKKDLKKLHRTR